MIDITATQASVGVLAMIGGWGLSAVRTIVRSKSENTAAEASAASVNVDTALDLVKGVRAEMNERVTTLTREVGRLTGRLEATELARGRERTENDTLRRENASLRNRVEALERQIANMGRTGATGARGETGATGAKGDTGAQGEHS